MMRIDIESEAVLVPRLGTLRFAARDERSDRGVGVQVEMNGAARRGRVAECSVVGILVVIVAVILGESQRGVNASELRGDRRRELPFVAVLAMVQGRDERGEARVRVRRDAEVVVRVAAGEAEGE